jgi:ferredoxin-NADP reductase
VKTRNGTFPVLIRSVEQITPDIRLYTLADPDGEQLPAFSGGSHVVVLIPEAEKTYRNPYSLAGSPFDTSVYRIAVRREMRGRGGSRRLHDYAVGETLLITFPINRFALDKRALKHVLIGGGVGLTPMLAQLEELRVGTLLFELHYSYRGAEHGGLAREIIPGERGSVTLYDSRAGTRMDLRKILEAQPLGTHVSVCGPRSMVASVMAVAHELDWPNSHIHFEEFVEQTVGEAFEATLNRSGLHVRVPPEMSLLEVAEQAGLEVPYLCRGGACGHCETTVLELDGEIIHADIWLSDDDKRFNRKMMPCISRARCRKLVLDL